MLLVCTIDMLIACYESTWSVCARTGQVYINTFDKHLTLLQCFLTEYVPYEEEIGPCLHSRSCTHHSNL